MSASSGHKFLHAITFTSNPASESALFGPRHGCVVIQRPNESASLEIKTPSLVVATSRGVIPHLSRDHVKITEAIRWVHVPFESFLEHLPPVPTLQAGPRPLHKFLGYIPSQHIVSMSPRDPFDGRDMPANGKDHVSAYCIRGVRKITSQAWKSYAASCQPDVAVALSDTPFTPPPHSQKRLTKSIERSAAWLSNILQPRQPAVDGQNTPADGPAYTDFQQTVFVHMVGGVNERARGAFADALMDPLEDKELIRLQPLRTLDDGVAGYIFDLVPLHAALTIKTNTSSTVVTKERGAMNVINQESGTGARKDSTSHVDVSAELPPLLRTSLERLPSNKPRFVNSARSPHEMLRLVRDVGIDFFDAHWAQRAADIGVALDFCFPVSQISEGGPLHDTRCPGPRRRDSGRMDLGHNLYDSRYAHDHSRLASCYLDAVSAGEGLAEDSTSSAPVRICPCAACSPRSPPTHLKHSSVDDLSFSDEGWDSKRFEKPFTRAYIHHLLHTHEMSAHSLLVMHNLSVLDSFFVGIQAVLAGASDSEVFSREADEFLNMYDEHMVVFDEATSDWAGVEAARGKGRLTREKIKQAEFSLGTAVDL